MNEFNVGDRVRLISDKYLKTNQSMGLNIGDIFTIISVERFDDHNDTYNIDHQYVNGVSLIPAFVHAEEIEPAYISEFNEEWNKVLKY